MLLMLIYIFSILSLRELLFCVSAVKMEPANGGLTCENCGIVGDARTFCKTGRFCSQTCVGRFAGK